MMLLLGAASCGGKSGNSGDQGGSGTAGSPSGGGAGTKPGDCQLDGHTYKDGESFPASDGCNTCHCDEGDIGCTQIACGLGDQCSSLASSYQALIERAETCDVHAENECTLSVSGGLACGCQTFVSPGRFSNDAAAALAQQFAANGCAPDVACNPCPGPPLRGRCGANGQCMAQDTASERACKVGGAVYPSGYAPIQDPFSCNQCSCQDGELACDDAGCAKPCPADTAPGKGCDQCGPTDNCEVVEIGCMPACVDTCALGSCVDGACVHTCA